MAVPESAFGHGDFMMIRAELVRVVGGPGEALVAALIYWRAREGSPYAYERDGSWWWNASQIDLGNATGLTRDQVQTAGKKLTDRGMVATVQHQLGGIQDRSYSYRVVTETPIAPNGAIDSAVERRVDSAERRDLPSKTEKINNTQRQMPSDLSWNNAHSVKASAKGVDVDVEFAKFVDYHLARGSKFVDWDRAFHTWLNNARPEVARGSQGPVRKSRDEEIQDVLNDSLGLDQMNDAQERIDRDLHRGLGR